MQRTHNYHYHINHYYIEEKEIKAAKWGRTKTHFRNREEHFMLISAKRHWRKILLRFKIKRTDQRNVHLVEPSMPRRSRSLLPIYQIFGSSFVQRRSKRNRTKSSVQKRRGEVYSSKSILEKDNWTNLLLLLIKICSVSTFWIQ